MWVIIMDSSLEAQVRHIWSVFVWLSWPHLYGQPWFSRNYNYIHVLLILNYYYSFISDYRGAFRCFLAWSPHCSSWPSTWGDAASSLVQPPATIPAWQPQQQWRQYLHQWSGEWARYSQVHKVQLSLDIIQSFQERKRSGRNKRAPKSTLERDSSGKSWRSTCGFVMFDLCLRSISSLFIRPGECTWRAEAPRGACLTRGDAEPADQGSEGLFPAATEGPPDEPPQRGLHGPLCLQQGPHPGFPGEGHINSPPFVQKFRLLYLLCRTTTSKLAAGRCSWSRRSWRVQEGFTLRNSGGTWRQPNLAQVRWSWLEGYDIC